jgi:hypothetical protein
LRAGAFAVTAFELTAEQQDLVREVQRTIIARELYR